MAEPDLMNLVRLVARKANRRWGAWLRFAGDEVESAANLAVACAWRRYGKDVTSSPAGYQYAYGRLVSELRATGYLPSRELQAMHIIGIPESRLACSGRECSGDCGDDRWEDSDASPIKGAEAVDVRATDAWDLMASVLGVRDAAMAWRSWVVGDDQAEVGRRFGITKQRVGQLLARSRGRVQRAWDGMDRRTA